MDDHSIQMNLLAFTARWAAKVRAVENIHPNRIFADPWAENLAGKTGRLWMADRTPESTIPIVLRTRYFDDFLERVTTRGGLRQVVLLAGGMDTRAFRLSWPGGVHLFELDQAELLAEKEGVLRAAGAKPGCTRTIIRADLTRPWDLALIEAGFDPLRPTAWLLEGVLIYLPVDDINEILAAITRLSASESWLGFDIVNSLTLTHPATREMAELQARSGAPWVGVMDDPLSYLGERGWRGSLTQAGAPDANHERWPYPVIPPNMPGMPHHWFVTAKREAH